MNTDTKQQFLRDVTQHQMTVLRDDGLCRHLRFQQPGSIEMHFDLITWPGNLCYTGDMGTYVFSRIADMFDFFRRPDKTYRVNLSYWAEKVDAAPTDGVMKFSMKKFTEEVTAWIDRLEKQDCAQDQSPHDLKLCKEAYAELRQAVLEDVLNCDDNEVRAYDAVVDFQHSGDAWAAAFGPKSYFTFTDFWEVDVREYTHRFKWCCEALAWGVACYDAAKAAETQRAAECAQ